MVERGGFEPPKAYADRFTVCSLWPLGNLSSKRLYRPGEAQESPSKPFYLPCNEKEGNNFWMQSQANVQTDRKKTREALRYVLSYHFGQSAVNGNGLRVASCECGLRVEGAGWRVRSFPSSGLGTWCGKLQLPVRNWQRVSFSMRNFQCGIAKRGLNGYIVEVELVCIRAIACCLTGAPRLFFRGRIFPFSGFSWL